MRAWVFNSLLLGFSFLIFVGFATRWTGKPLQDTDYYNQLAHSFRAGRLDIDDPFYSHDLSWYRGKWYPFHGPLPAVPIALLQLVTGKVFIPTLYTNAFVGALGVVATYFLLNRFRKVYFPKATFSPLIMTLVLSFGTVQFWVASRSGVWFQAQTYTYLLTALGLLALMRRRRTTRDCTFSVLFFSLTLLTRPNAVLLLVIPAVLYLGDRRTISVSIASLLKLVFPFFIMLSIFFTYNYVRFGEILETGVNYHKFHSYFEYRYQLAGGWFSLINVPYNLWYMTLEIPRLTREGSFTSVHRIRLVANPEGNSIFFLTPPLLAVFLALPWKEKNQARRRMMVALWSGVLLTLIPILMLTGTGWYQFGYRYILDVTAPVLLLIVLGMKGKFNGLFYLGVVFSVWMWTVGVIST
jgi:hypothetical protein